MSFNKKNYSLLKIILIISISISGILTQKKNSNSKNFFNPKNFKYSLYFSDIDPLSNLEFNSEIQRPHKIDQVIFKLEHKSSQENTLKSIKNSRRSLAEKFKKNLIKSRTFLNLKISKKFYEVNFCIDEMDAFNKNQLLKYFPNNNSNNNNKRTNDYFHQDLINIFRKKDFTEIDPKKYNDEKVEKRYNDKNEFFSTGNSGKSSNEKKYKKNNNKNNEYDSINDENDNDENNEEENSDFFKEFDIGFEKCFRKFEFLNEDNPRFNMEKSADFNLMKIINETNIINNQNAKEKNNNNKEDYNDNNFNNEYEDNSAIFKHFLDEFINIKISDTILKLRKFVNNYIKWEDDNIIIEFNFNFNNNNLLNLNLNEEIDNNDNGDNGDNKDTNDINKFLLNKIFIYFLQSPKLELDPDFINKINLNFNNFKTFKGKKDSNNNNSNNNFSGNSINNNKDHYISLIQTYENFENIFIDYKILKKQIKYTKDFYGEKKPKISIKQIQSKNETSPLIKKFYTLQRESIFHNKLTLYIDLQNKKKEILSTNQNNKICLFYYFHITEDTYIEKNEFKLLMSKSFPNFEKDFFFSEEIDQEIPSDVSKQYFASFAFCGKKEIFIKEIFQNEENLNLFKIEIPIHFRYQPPLYYTSHQEVFLNLPFVDLLIQENQIFKLEEILTNKNFFKFENYSTKKFEDRTRVRNKEILRYIYSKEIQERLRFLNEINLMFENLDEIRHFIPVAQMQHFYFVIIGTFLTACIGFFIVLFGVINYKIKEKIN